MEAEKLRIGEERRDASTKIRGFLYQDLLTLKTLIESSLESKVLSEWVEDIYIENDTDISIIQAKYYPSSTIKFSEIFEDMYYQYLKVKLYDIDKNASYICYFYGDTCFSKESCLASFSKEYVEKELLVADKKILIESLKKCSNMDERKKLIFSNMNMQKYIEEFNLQTVKTEIIDKLYDTVKESLYYEFKNIGVLSFINTGQAKELIISIFISLIQSKYYSGSEHVNDRYLDKNLMNSYLTMLLESEDKTAYKELIIAVIDNIIDRIYIDIIDEAIDNQATVKEYDRLSRSTKKFFRNLLEIREDRYKFINTISIEDIKILNIEKYNELTYNEEYLLFVENKQKINSFIKTLWKIVFSLDSKLEIEDVLMANHDFIEFTHEREVSNLVLLSSELSSDVTREYKKILKRTKNFKDRPNKWYMRNCVKGIHNYEYDISDIDRDQLDISRIDNDYKFQVECMKCVKCDYKQMEIRDNIYESIFCDKCVED